MYKDLSGKSRFSLFLTIDLFAIAISFFGAFILRFDFSIPVEYGNFLPGLVTGFYNNKINQFLLVWTLSGNLALYQPVGHCKYR